MRIAFNSKVHIITNNIHIVFGGLIIYIVEIDFPQCLPSFLANNPTFADVPLDSVCVSRLFTPLPPDVTLWHPKEVPRMGAVGVNLKNATAVTTFSGLAKYLGINFRRYSPNILCDTMLLL